MLITDPRIGRRGPKGRIVQTPKQYVSGEGYTPAANPAPTVFWLDKVQEYYVILPVSMSRIKPETHAMFLKIVGKEDQIDFPYNDGSDELSHKTQQVQRSVILTRDNEDDYNEKPVKKSAAEINADRKAKLLAELALIDEQEELENNPSLEPKKIVKMVKSEAPTFKLPSFNKKSKVELDEDEDEDEDAPRQPVLPAALGLVPKPPKVLKSTLKPETDNDSSGTDPKKPNVDN